MGTSEKIVAAQQARKKFGPSGKSRLDLSEIPSIPAGLAESGINNTELEKVWPTVGSVSRYRDSGQQLELCRKLDCPYTAIPLLDVSVREAFL